MIFTLWYIEPIGTRGLEFCCDWCNKPARESGEALNLGNPWWYQRYLQEDPYPSNFVCNECKIKHDIWVANNLPEGGN